MNLTYEVTKEDSFEFCIKLIKTGKYNPLILDFASSSNPGEQNKQELRKKVYVEEVI
jgi:hypothetical protein